MTDDNLSNFIKEEKNCYKSRQEQINYCSSYDVRKHQGYMVVFDTRIRNPYDEKIKRRIILNSADDKFILETLNKFIIWKN